CHRKELQSNECQPICSGHATTFLCGWILSPQRINARRCRVPGQAGESRGIPPGADQRFLKMRSCYPVPQFTYHRQESLHPRGEMERRWFDVAVVIDRGLRSVSCYHGKRACALLSAAFDDSRQKDSQRLGLRLEVALDFVS